MLLEQTVLKYQVACHKMKCVGPGRACINNLDRIQIAAAHMQDYCPLTDETVQNDTVWPYSGSIMSQSNQARGKAASEMRHSNTPTIHSLK